MKGILYFIWQCTWGIVQTLLGFVMFLIHIHDRHYFYHGAIITEWKIPSSVSLGLFVFCAEEPGFAQRCGLSRDEAFSMLLTHEYGHTIQSLILGPLYLIVIGIPSVTWAFFPCFVKMRKERNIPYSRAYCEKWANSLGEKVTGKVSVRDLI